MFKFLNTAFFVGTLLKQLAKFFAPLAPEFKELKEANARSKYIQSLEKELNDVKQSNILSKDVVESNGKSNTVNP